MNYKELPVSKISHNCRRENQRFLEAGEHDARYCLELFRRAFIFSSEEAWQAIYTCYEEQVRRWIRSHPSFSFCHEDADYFVNMAFAKFWQAITPEKFLKFPTLGHILQYLKTCVAGAILDHLRHKEKQEKLELSMSVKLTEDVVLEKMTQDNLWVWVQNQLKNDQEKLVMHRKFLFDMPPRDIYATNPELFPEGINEIYRILENVLRRLRRNVISKDILS